MPLAPPSFVWEMATRSAMFGAVVSSPLAPREKTGSPLPAAGSAPASKLVLVKTPCLLRLPKPAMPEECSLRVQSDGQNPEVLRQKMGPPVQRRKTQFNLHQFAAKARTSRCFRGSHITPKMMSSPNTPPPSKGGASGRIQNRCQRYS
jgi:hypothetical protein